MPDIIGAFVTGLANFLFSIVKDRVDEPVKERHRQSESDRLRRSEEVRLEAERALAEYTAEANLRRIEYESLVRRYPFGEPGRLRRKYRVGERPCVIIGPVHLRSRPTDVSIDVFGVIGKACGSDAYFQGIPEALACDEGRIRSLRRLDAVEVAALEFPNQPAIIVFFERCTDGVVAQACFSNMFPTTTGDQTFIVQVARYRRSKESKATNSPALSVGGAAFPSFSDLDLPRPRSEALQLISRTVALFVAAALDIYWYTLGQHSALFSALAFADNTVGMEDQERDLSAAPVSGRIAQELTDLRSAGFQCEHVRVHERQDAFLVDLDSMSVMLVLPEGYPRVPPSVRVISGNEVTDYQFEAGAWTPERTLAEVVGGLR